MWDKYFSMPLIRLNEHMQIEEVPLREAKRIARKEISKLYDVKEYSNFEIKEDLNSFFKDKYLVVKFNINKTETSNLN